MSNRVLEQLIFSAFCWKNTWKSKRSPTDRCLWRGQEGPLTALISGVIWKLFVKAQGWSQIRYFPTICDTCLPGHITRWKRICPGWQIFWAIPISVPPVFIPQRVVLSTHSKWSGWDWSLQLNFCYVVVPDKKVGIHIRIIQETRLFYKSFPKSKHESKHERTDGMLSIFVSPAFLCLLSGFSLSL